jgi:hypothetical protein
MPLSRFGPGIASRTHPHYSLSKQWLFLDGISVGDMRAAEILQLHIGGVSKNELTSMERFRTSRRSDEPLRTRLVELAWAKPRFGYRLLQILLRRSGEQVNHKRLVLPASVPREYLNK